jgi:NAD(P)-dependent dehydrogenase (short-subunit alcohol dehydrogenase family)
MSKVWFVTGASSGIGAATSTVALRRGHRVVATARDPEKLRAALADGASERLALVSLDVRSETEVQRAVDVALSRFGRVDVLVNNAAYGLVGSFESLTAEQIENQFATNFFGVTYLMRSVLPIMRGQRSGHIINLSSLAGLIGYKHCSAYAATKFAVEGLSLSVAQEVAHLGVKVTVVEPGFFRTSFAAPESLVAGAVRVDGYETSGEIRALWESLHGRQLGDPEKLANVLLELVAMDAPPRQLLAGSDAVTLYTSALEARARAVRSHAALSNSTDGTFTPRESNEPNHSLQPFTEVRR